MFSDPTITGSWSDLIARLDGGVLARWGRADVRLREFGNADRLLAAWADPARTHRVAAGLIRLAAADGGRDDDALLLLLHLLSGLVWRLTRQLADLGDDVMGVVLSELTCRIRSYPWRRRHGGLVANLELDTRRAVLADLRPSDRCYPERVEQLTDDGMLDIPVGGVGWPDELGVGDDLDLVDLLVWASEAGVDRSDLAFLVASERVRDEVGAGADWRVAAAYGITRRTVLRRRSKTLAALRGLAPAYLAATA
jgi:hypothetical protein